jgi:hypothetical protein
MDSARNRKSPKVTKLRMMSTATTSSCSRSLSSRPGRAPLAENRRYAAPAVRAELRREVP